MSELFTVYSPQGEKFEVSRANFRDLTTHAGWTTKPPETDDRPEEAQPEPVQAPEPVEPEFEPAGGNGETDAGEPETAEPETAEPESAPEAPQVRLTPEDFDDLPEKADVDAYIKETFGFNADGRWSREKLIAKAIELATQA